MKTHFFLLIRKLRPKAVTRLLGSDLRLPGSITSARKSHYLPSVAITCPPKFNLEKRVSSGRAAQVLRASSRHAKAAGSIPGGHIQELRK